MAPIQDVAGELSGVKDDLNKAAGTFAGIGGAEAAEESGAADESATGEGQEADAVDSTPAIAAVPDLSPEPDEPATAQGKADPAEAPSAARPKTIEEIIADAKAAAAEAADEQHEDSGSGDQTGEVA